jgi:hypothetical protein
MRGHGHLLEATHLSLFGVPDCPSAASNQRKYGHYVSSFIKEHFLLHTCEPWLTCVPVTLCPTVCEPIHWQPSTCC